MHSPPETQIYLNIFANLNWNNTTHKHYELLLTKITLNVPKLSSRSAYKDHTFRDLWTLACTASVCNYKYHLVTLQLCLQALCTKIFCKSFYLSQWSTNMHMSSNYGRRDFKQWRNGQLTKRIFFYRGKKKAKRSIHCISIISKFSIMVTHFCKDLQIVNCCKTDTYLIMIGHFARRRSGCLLHQL